MSDRRPYDFTENLPSLGEMMANGGRLLVTMCLRDLANEDYAAYLRTNHWQDIRSRRLRQDGFRCKVCLCRGLVDVHHIHYAHLGDEPMDDVVTLCRKHHRIQHAVLAIRTRAALEAHLLE